MGGAAFRLCSLAPPPRRVSSALIQNRTQLLRGGASAGPKREPKKREEEGEEKKTCSLSPVGLGCTRWNTRRRRRENGELNGELSEQV